MTRRKGKLQKTRGSKPRRMTHDADKYIFPLAPRLTPRPAPTVGIFDAPHACVQINQFWLSHIIGMIDVLNQPDAWSGDEDEQYRARQEIEKLFNALKDDADCPKPPCREIRLYDQRIEWIPNNPFVADQPTPPGYNRPPWYLAPETNLIGARAGDVVVDILTVLPGLSWTDLTAPLPRFRLSLNGTGTVSLYFCNLILGSELQVQVDGDIGKLFYVDVERNLLQLPYPEDTDQVIWEWEFTEDGDHFIDVTVLPAVDTEGFPVQFGGGIRKIEICDFAVPCPECPDCPDCPPPDCPDCPDEDCGCDDCGDGSTSDCGDCNDC